jgi:cell wall-associated NlpC family hydrolase
MRRVLLLALLAALGAAPSAPAASRSWAQPEIKVVVSHGLMAESVGAFRPDALLTQSELTELIAGLTADPEPQAAPKSTGRVTMAQLDAQLVRALGLGDEASLFYQGAAAAGLRPPSRFGTEVVARLLGLRKNHPAAQDNLERLPSEPASRAEAAFSAAQILRFADREVPGVEEAAASFEVPFLTPWQRRVLTTAFGLIGLPYVWGGESEARLSPYGMQAAGGFDCSGFAWRVYKLQSYPAGKPLAQTLRGRTAAAMAGEVAPRRRIRPARLAPADLVFFGRGGPQAKPAQIDHMGIYIGNGWMIHSSRFGVALVRVEGWYSESLAWGRRPLAEAGL